MTEHFTPAEKHLILNRLGQASFNADHREGVAKCLAKKREAGITITDKEIAICISEHRESGSNNRGSTPSKRQVKSVRI